MDLWSHVVFYWWWSIGGFSSARSCQGSRILSIPTTARTHPYSTDGLALYDILHTYTEDYLSIFYSGESLVRDPAVRGWWQAIVSLAPTLGLGPLNRAQQLVDLITQVMFTVTGFHYQVGRVSPYLLDPAFLTGKIRAGSQMSDIQATVHVLGISRGMLNNSRRSPTRSLRPVV